jgi:hypothetical protein
MKASVVNKQQQQQQSTFSPQTVVSPKSGVSVKDDKYNQYLNLLRINVPKEAVMSRMLIDGCTEPEIFAVLEANNNNLLSSSSSSKGLISGSVVAPNLHAEVITKRKTAGLPGPRAPMPSSKSVTFREVTGNNNNSNSKQDLLDTIGSNKNKAFFANLLEVSFTLIKYVEITF